VEIKIEAGEDLTNPSDLQKKIPNASKSEGETAKESIQDGGWP